MKRLLIVAAVPVVALLSCARVSGPLASVGPQSAPDYQNFDQRFSQDVQPVLRSYCYGCHGGPQPESMMDLTAFGNTAQIVAALGVWEHVHDRLEAGEMPPRGRPQPTTEESQRVVQWIRSVRDYEAQRSAGDPGIVLAHRLSNAEYNYTIHDLTGADIQPAREFPVDPANEAGFDNSGETLALSPALLTRYLDAARKVSEHIVFKPTGFDFAPHVAVTDTDRDRYAVNRIMDFYQRQPTDLADYFFVLWQFQNREALGRSNTTLEDFAAEGGVAPSYLAMVWELLQDRRTASGPVAELQERWDDLPVAATVPNDAVDPVEAVRAATEQLRDFVADAREKLAWQFEVQIEPPLHRVTQTLVMNVNRQQAAHHRMLNPNVLVPADQADPDADDFDSDLVIPSDPAERAEAIAVLEKFSDVFPDAFIVSERTSMWLARRQTGRLLSAGFHSAPGYFRDDGPLYDLILSDEGRREIDALWQELDFITLAPARQLSGFVWFERTDSPFMLSEEFSHIRPENQDISSEEIFGELKQLYLAKVVASGLSQEVQDIVALYFDELGAAIRWTDMARLEAEPYHLESLREFAERAYRRPLSQAEGDRLLSFYRELRDVSGLGHEDAIRDAVVSVLVSPDFSFRVDLVTDGRETQVGNSTVAPLADYSLANRLSYFLWSSMPDTELLAHAEAGDLHRPEVLRAQISRMLRDDRVRRLATEFGTNWLGVRRFEEYNSVGRDRFPMFTDDLRQAFFEEPIRFLNALILEDHSVLDLLFGDYTFVNPLLATHYDVPVSSIDADEWVRVDGAGRYGRGGLLPMAVFLTNYSPGLRTSPVKRGHWLATKVLGQHVPAPPPNVPQLPADEADLGDLTLRETLAQHRENPACASCHATFDHFGLVFEGFGPVGERRERDFGGREVETVADFPDGIEREGLQGLREYLRTERQEDFVDNFSRRLLTYALGRGLLLSDDVLIEDMRAALESDEYRFSSLVEAIVTSPQFLTKRVADRTSSAAQSLNDGK